MPRRRTSSPTRSRTASSSASRRRRPGLLDAAGIDPDDGVVVLVAAKASVGAFLKPCHAVRFWEREALVDRT